MFYCVSLRISMLLLPSKVGMAQPQWTYYPPDHTVVDLSVYGATSLQWRSIITKRLCDLRLIKQMPLCHAYFVIAISHTPAYHEQGREVAAWSISDILVGEIVSMGFSLWLESVISTVVFPLKLGRNPRCLQKMLCWCDIPCTCYFITQKVQYNAYNYNYILPDYSNLTVWLYYAILRRALPLPIILRLQIVFCMFRDSSS